MKRKPKIPAKRAPMPEGYDGTKTKKQQGSPGLQAVGGVHILFTLLSVNGWLLESKVFRPTFYSCQNLCHFIPSSLQLD